MEYKIFAGLGGGFGGAKYLSTEECSSYEEACEIAYDAACEIYEEYAGLHGLRDLADCRKEAENSEDCLCEEDIDDYAWELYTEERESWLEYYVEGLS